LHPELARHQVVPTLANDSPVWVMAEPVALDQIVYNLLLNALQALDALPAGQRQLELTVLASAATGVLTVADSGPGIPPEALPHLFEPFYTTRKGGLGLGLSLCETLAANMGGTLTAANQPRRGAVFTLSLPACPPQ
jgi:C4-dicarboxylate-specific signal transduction histidine kinase